MLRRNKSFPRLHRRYFGGTFIRFALAFFCHDNSFCHRRGNIGAARAAHSAQIGSCPGGGRLQLCTGMFKYACFLNISRRGWHAAALDVPIAWVLNPLFSLERASRVCILPYYQPCLKAKLDEVLWQGRGQQRENHRKW